MYDRRPGPLNRVLLAIVGLVALAGGLAAGATGLGLVPFADPSTPVVPAGWLEQVAGMAWIPYAATAAGVVLAVLGLCWLLAQLPRSRPNPSVRLTDDLTRGLTTVNARTITSAVEDEISAYEGVAKARADLVTETQPVTLRLAVTVEPNTNLGELRRRIANEASDHLRDALELTDLDTRVVFATR